MFKLVLIFVYSFEIRQCNFEVIIKSGQAKRVQHMCCKSQLSTVKEV